MVLFFPEREVALRLFEYDIRWYGVLYLVAFALAAWLLPRLARVHQLRVTSDQWLAILTLSVAGVLLGGRLGYVVLYESAYFASQPSEIFAIYKGGMSFHGGLVGVVLALWLASRYLAVSFWQLLDVVVIPAAIGLSLGRVGNYINQELVGTLTTLPWRITIPGQAGTYHPVQLYAALKNAVIALVCARYFFHARPHVPGRTAALFLILYGLLRPLIGFVRQPDGIVLSLGTLTLTQGQLLTLPLLMLGLVLWYSLPRSSRE